MLSLDTIKRDASSYVDPHGFVFHHEGQVYRYIYPAARPRYQQLLDGGVLADLERRCGLVSSQAADVQLAGLPPGLVLRHRRITPLTYCVEWCPSMLQDAAVATLELARAALPHGLMLQDAYPWNVLFDGHRPVFVDVTSLVPPDERTIWPAQDQFEAFFLRPLALAHQGHGEVARRLLYDNLEGISLDQLYRLSSLSHRLRHPGLGLARRFDRAIQRSVWLKSRIRQFAENACRDASPAVRDRFFARLLNRVRRLRFARPGDPWANYYAEIDPAFDRQEKLRRVGELLAATAPASVLDLGCNAGVFSIQAAKLGARVVSLDSSEACIELLYATAKAQNLPITPLVGNVLCPTPAFGFLGEQYPSLWQRVASHTVLCLGLMHHLHLTGRQSWERIVDLLDRVSQRGLIFEFVGMDDANIEHLPQRRQIEYDLDTVVAALRNRFPQIAVYESDRPTRRLLLCQKQ